MANSVTLEVSPKKAAEIASFYQEEAITLTTPYAAFQAKHDRIAITIYKKEKGGLVNVLFQGESAEREASIWGKGISSKAAKESPRKKGRKPRGDTIGSDEVGTGDFFGPVIVCAAFVPSSRLSRLHELGVTDSKKLEDGTILSLGPTLIQEFDYSELCLDNETYNELAGRGMNLNEMKAKMHNRCLLNLLKKHPEASLCQDQFAAEKLYYSYLKEEKEVAKPISFSTKGELAYPSVALASCIARYAFLRKMKALGDHYGLEIPLGASARVDSFAKVFQEKYGSSELRKISKSNFANAKRLK